jgi:hypothetical protein
LPLNSFLILDLRNMYDGVSLAAIKTAFCALSNIAEGVGMAGFGGWGRGVCGVGDGWGVDYFYG